MKLSEFVKTELEQVYLGKRIKNWIGSTTFIVEQISVVDGGVDPQWEISLHSKLCNEMRSESKEWYAKNSPDGRTPTPHDLYEHWCKGYMESYTMNYCNDNMPEIVEDSDNESEEIENGWGLASCEQCGEKAWDGYICHACGMKEI